MRSLNFFSSLVGVPLVAVALRDRKRSSTYYQPDSSFECVLSTPNRCMKTRIYHSIRPIVFLLDPETAHAAALITGQSVAHLYFLSVQFLQAIESFLEWSADSIFGPSHFPPPAPPSPSRLTNTVCGIQFTRPCGISAGFDKNGKLGNLFNSHILSIGHAEIGSVSYGPWLGNPKPRLFRLVPDRAIINRMGLNNDGSAVVASRLSRLESSSASTVRLGINITKTPDPLIEGKDAVQDFVKSLEFMQHLQAIHWITLNISCPNTAEGKTFEDTHALSDLLEAIAQHKRDKKIFLKLSPMRNTSDTKTDIIQIAKKFKVDALVIANTVPDRNFALKSHPSLVQQKGGLSGPLLLERSIQLIEQGFKRGFTVIGVGGISSGQDAYKLMRRGASLIQLYTAIVYDGPFVLDDIHNGLERCLLIDGYRNVSEIIGKDLE